MKSYRIVTIALCLFVCSHFPVQAQDTDTELSKLTELLAGQIKDHASKKVTVLDLTDLDGNPSEIGKYIADQMTVAFVMKKHDFAILDRANLKRIMDEHKLTASGLVDPENAKKLGMFAGVDAMIFGKVFPAGNKVNVTATIVTTDTAEIIGAGKASFLADSTIQQLQANAIANPSKGSGGDGSSGGTGGRADLSDDKPMVVKVLGNLVVELQSLKILRTGEYLLTMTLTNRSTKGSLWVALANKTSLVSANGFVYGRSTATGLYYPRVFTQYGQQQFESFNPATEIKPGDSTTATLAISAADERPATPGVCTLQLQFLLADDYEFARKSPKLSSSPNLITKLEAK